VPFTSVVENASELMSKKLIESVLSGPLQVYGGPSVSLRVQLVDLVVQADCGLAGPDN
jgi:hypothetical protein